MNQDPTVTTSDELSTQPPRNRITLSVDMSLFYPRPGHLCNHGRIYSAFFDDQRGILTIHICHDDHVPNLKVYSLDGIIITHYCYLSEKRILDNIFLSTPFLNWRQRQIQNL